MNRATSTQVAVIVSALFLGVLNPTANAQVLADSRTDFSGIQGQGGWSYGYRSYTLDGGEENYDAETSFLAFSGGEGQGDWDGGVQFWDSVTSQWTLNTAAAAPWTFLSAEGVHPNGENSFPNEEHWSIRRWDAGELTTPRLLAITWHTRKQAAAGSGVTGGIWINGDRLVSVALAGSDTTGVTRTNYVTVDPDDRIDLVLTPVGISGDRGDGSDGSFHWMTIEIPADTDADGLPDAWERLYAPDLTTLNGTGDSDNDTLDDVEELALGTNPTNEDTDGDGLVDGAETNTGTYVSPTNAGTDPLRADTDGDGRPDGDEVNGTIKTDVFKPDTDEDTYSDGLEVATGHNPNDANDTLVSSLIANSVTEFSGVQGQDGWNHGYRNFTVDGGALDYDPVEDFIPFPGGSEGGEWDGTTQVWTGSQWDLNTAAAGPWTELGAETTHPNGVNSPPNQEHWVIRRWTATELTGVTPLALRYHFRKTNLGGGNGVSAGLHINGRRVDSAAVAFNDGVGQIRTYFANVAPTDVIDVYLSPRGPDNGTGDGSDGSAFYLHVDPVLPSNPRQPNGDLFIPAGAGDTDADGMPDVWEQIYLPGNLAGLTATGDYDSDGLPDVQEYARDSDPTKPDTDGDGLTDNVETKTGTFVSATNTGSDPKKPDSDGDTLSDGAEVQGTPPTDPNKNDTDDDGFHDADEIAEGTDPTDPEDNVLVYVIANSIAEFSGVQGTNGWFNGYRNYTVDGGGTNYNPQTQFIPYVGGPDQGDWEATTQQWAGGAWELETAAAGPWTYQSAEGIHPNGENSFPNEEHWAIRRWVADELTADTPVTILWRVIKENAAGGGVGGSLYINGNLVDSVVIAGNDITNAVRRYVTTLKKGDIVDLALTPENVDGTRTDGADGSITWFWVDTRVRAAGIEILTFSFSATRQFTLSWESEAGALYTVESSPDLRTWTPLQAGIPSGGTTTSYTDSPAAGVTTRFYRVLKQ